MQLLLGVTALMMVAAIALAAPKTAVMTLALLLLMAGSTSLPALVHLSVPMRTLAVVAVLVLATRESDTDSLANPLSQRPLLIAFVLFIGSMLAFITVVHDEGRLAEVCLGIASCLAFMSLPLRVLSPPHLIRALRWALFIVLLGSVFASLTIPSVAIRGGRLQGLANNANLLGFYTLLYVGIVVSTEPRLKRILGPVALACVILVLSSSRTSAIAVVLLLAGSALMKVGPMRKLFPWITIALGGAVLVWQDVLTGELGLLRQSDSRSASWDQMLVALESDPLQGIGLDGPLVQVASSPLRALAAGGLVAGALLLAAIVCLVLATRFAPAARIFVLAALVHSLAEGWLVSLTGPIVLLFITTVVGLLSYSKQNDGSSLAAPVVHRAVTLHPRKTE